MFSSQVAPNLVDSRKHNAYSHKSNNISIMSVFSAHIADLAGICLFKKEKINTFSSNTCSFFSESSSWITHSVEDTTNKLSTPP